ncbi:MAG: hypothetical protein ACI89X_003091 [Planctomycetota bacterium]|jgi:hypothetical protein
MAGLLPFAMPTTSTAQTITATAMTSSKKATYAIVDLVRTEGAPRSARIGQKLRPALRQQRPHDVAVHVGQTEAAALIAIGQPFVIEA